jgi:catechol 2,3-dioxygenase-like lactoylglutathione lyase family enzyme
MAPVITAVDHIGVRVRDRARSCAFYGSLGFGVVYEDQGSPVIILRNPRASRSTWWSTPRPARTSTC